MISVEEERRKREEEEASEEWISGSGKGRGGSVRAVYEGNPETGGIGYQADKASALWGQPVSDSAGDS